MERGWGGDLSQSPVPNMNISASLSGAWDPRPLPLV